MTKPILILENGELMAILNPPDKPIHDRFEYKAEYLSALKHQTPMTLSIF
jgi:hypothetical protein